MRPAWPTWWSKRRCPPSSTWKTRSPPSMPQDKVLAYRNWLGILQGTLTEQVTKGGKTLHARPEPGPRLHRARGRAAKCALHGRSLLFLRNVGHLMTNPAILWDGGKEIPEGILDAVITTRDRDARPASARARTASATRAPARSTSSSRRCTVRPKWPSPTSCSAASRSLLGLPRQHGQAGHHGRRAPHQREPARPASRRRRRASRSSTPASSIAPATRCTPRCKPAR